jgi:hypothetical protein
VGSCEYNNEPSGSIKGKRFLNQLSDYQLLKDDSIPRSKYFDFLIQNPFCQYLKLISPTDVSLKETKQQRNQYPV